jgi:hypothetical protein
MRILLAVDLDLKDNKWRWDCSRKDTGFCILIVSEHIKKIVYEDESENLIDKIKRMVFREKIPKILLDEINEKLNEKEDFGIVN